MTLWGPHGTGVAYPPTGPVSYDIALPAGVIAFRWITGAPNDVNVDNGSNMNHANLPGFFAGIDPYLATGTFQTVGDAVFLGLTDLPGTGDHDFQDLGVRLAAVPEPASVFLLGTAGAGFAGYQIVRYRRRRQQRQSAKA
ncbi:MAG: PEP-CTERM sorting domain-containing protein [Gemmatales bacterium]